MTQPHSLVTLVSVAVATFALTTVPYGQSTQTPRYAPQGRAELHAGAQQQTFGFGVA
jgi:hypothetical protein